MTLTSCSKFLETVMKRVDCLGRKVLLRSMKVLKGKPVDIKTIGLRARSQGGWVRLIVEAENF